MTISIATAVARLAITRTKYRISRWSVVMRVASIDESFAIRPLWETVTTNVHREMGVR